MNSRIPIFVDLDSTLNNLDDAWLSWCNENIALQSFDMIMCKYPKDMLYWGWFSDHFGNKAHEFFKSNYYIEASARPGALEFLETLYSLKFQPIIISAPANKDNKEEKKWKRDWINKNLRTSFILNLIVTENKHYFTQEYILIDDNISNCLKHIFYNNSKAILFNFDGKYPYAKPLPTENFRGNLLYSTNYKDIISKLEVIYE